MASCQADSCGGSTSEPTDAPAIKDGQEPSGAQRPTVKAPQVVDTNPLSLTLITPSSLSLVVEEPSLAIEGKTRMDALLTVGNEIVEPDLDGQFSHTITLQPGHNLVEIIASTSTGEQKSLILAVIYAD